MARQIVTSDLGSNTVELLSVYPLIRIGRRRAPGC